MARTLKLILNTLKTTSSGFHCSLSRLALVFLGEDILLSVVSHLAQMMMTANIS